MLVTGGTGFIGSNLVSALLQHGYRVRILRRPDSRVQTPAEVETHAGDVRDLTSIRRAVCGCDTVFHTAALVTFARSRREEQYQVNVIGTKNVVDACLQESVGKLVHTSSIAAIGYAPPGGLATEDTPFNWGGTTGYKFSKHSAEREVASGVERGLFAVVVNPSVVIGERDIHFHGGQLIRDIRKGIIPFYIDGGMNIVYVGDVVRGQIQAALRGRNGERYILGGENLSHREIFARTAELIGGRPPFAKLPISFLRGGALAIETVCRVFGVQPYVTRDLVAGAGRFNWFSSEKAIRELGHTITPFDTTILRAYQWYRENGFLK